MRTQNPIGKELYTTSTILDVSARLGSHAKATPIHSATNIADDEPTTKVTSCPIPVFKPVHLKAVPLPTKLL